MDESTISAEIKSGVISYPWKRLFGPDKSVLFANLVNYKPNIGTTQFRLANNLLDPKFIDEKTGKVGYQYYISSDADYNAIDILGDYFNEEERLRAHRKDRAKSPYDDWLADGAAIITANNISPAALREKSPDSAAKIDLHKLRELLFAKYSEATLFKCSLSLAIYRRFAGDRPRILDISAGWGDRLLGALALAQTIQSRYVAFDPNTNLKRGHDAAIAAFAPKNNSEFIINYMPFEENNYWSAHPDEKFSLVFSSPPFFDFEIYVDGQAGQSINSYTSFDAWLNKFLLKSLALAWSHLEAGGYMIIHITDSKFIHVCKPMVEFVLKLPACQFMGVLGTRGSASGHIHPMWVWRKQI